jgi:hypothetical protein
MFAEERFISKKFGDAYDNWSQKTPSFFPKFRGYEKAGVPFSMKNVLKREYHGLFATVITFTLVYVLKQYFSFYHFKMSLPWIVFIISGTVFYLIVRIIVKTTRWLHVEGR